MNFENKLEANKQAFINDMFGEFNEALAKMKALVERQVEIITELEAKAARNGNG